MHIAHHGRRYFYYLSTLLSLSLIALTTTGLPHEPTFGRIPVGPEVIPIIERIAPPPPPLPTTTTPFGDSNNIVERQQQPTTIDVPTTTTRAPGSDSSTTNHADASNDNAVEKRQYAYVALTAPTTLTYTSTIFQTVTSQATFTQYATMTVTAPGRAAAPLNNVAAADGKLLNAAPHPSSPAVSPITPAGTVTVTSTPVEMVTKTIYVRERGMPIRYANANDLAEPGAAAAAAAAGVVTSTITHLATITQPAAGILKTVPVTTTVTGPPKSIVTITQASHVTVYQTSITGTTIIAVTVAAEHKRMRMKVKRQEPVTVTDTITPSTTILTTYTVTVPDTWALTTLYTATTTTVPNPNPVAATITTTLPVTVTSTTSIVVAPGTTTQPPPAAPPAANAVSSSSTVFVTVTDLVTMTSGGGGTSVVTDRVTATVPGLAVSTKVVVVTVTRTSVVDAVFSEYVVPTGAQ